MSTSTTTTGAPRFDASLRGSVMPAGFALVAEYWVWMLLPWPSSKHKTLHSGSDMMQHSCAELCCLLMLCALAPLGLVVIWSARRAFNAMHTADQWLALALDTIGALLSFLVSMLVVGLKGQLGASKSALVLERVRPRHWAAFDVN